MNLYKKMSQYKRDRENPLFDSKPKANKNHDGANCAACGFKYTPTLGGVPLPYIFCSKANHLDVTECCDNYITHPECPTNG
jgi:hypothetical protein